MGVSTERSSSRHPTGAVARVDWIMDVRRRADVNINNNNNGCLRCACVHTAASPARLSDVDARLRRLPQDAGGTRRDLIIGCAMLDA